jgi:hypothetical protein|tara:strand:+ start:228 stop:479 length:252 start_codon:yes stop_codon:yes gene_type:complete
MKDHKDFEYEAELVMNVLDELMKNWVLIKPKMDKHNNTLSLDGWGVKRGKVSNVSFSFSAVQATREEVNDSVRSIVMRPKLRS